MKASEFKFSFKRSSGFILITLNGHFDYDAWEINEKKMLKIINNKDKKIILEMSGLTYLSSRGIGFLIYLYDQVTKNNGIVALTGLNGLIKKVLTATDTIKIFKVYDTPEEAKEKLK